MFKIKTENFNAQTIANYDDMYNVIVNKAMPKTMAGLSVAAIFRLPTVDFSLVSKIYAMIETIDVNLIWDYSYLKSLLPKILLVEPQTHITSLKYPDLYMPKIPISIDTSRIELDTLMNDVNYNFEQQTFGKSAKHRYNGDFTKYILDNFKTMSHLTDEQIYLLELIKPYSEKQQKDIIMHAFDDNMEPLIINGEEIPVPKLTGTILPSQLKVQTIKLSKHLNDDYLLSNIPNMNIVSMIPTSVINEMKNLCSVRAIEEAIYNNKLTYTELLSLLGSSEPNVKILAALILNVNYGPNIVYNQKYFTLPPTNVLMSLILKSSICKGNITFPLPLDCVNTRDAYNLVADIAKFSLNTEMIELYCSQFKIPACMLYNVYKMCKSKSELYVVYTLFIMDGGGIAARLARSQLKPTFNQGEETWIPSEVNLIVKYPEFVRTSYTSTHEHFKYPLIDTTVNEHMVLCFTTGCSYITTFSGEVDSRLVDLENEGKCTFYTPIEIAHFIAGFVSMN